MSGSAATCLAVIAAAVVEHDRHFVGVEHVAPDREHVPFGGNQDAALIGFQAAEAAGAVELDHLRLDLAGNLRQKTPRRRWPAHRLPRQARQATATATARTCAELRIANSAIRIAPHCICILIRFIGRLCAGRKSYDRDRQLRKHFVAVADRPVMRQATPVDFADVAEIDLARVLIVGRLHLDADQIAVSGSK